jgi:hypothetical protein
MTGFVSVFEAAPLIGRALGRDAGAAIGHLPVLPRVVLECDGALTPEPDPDVIAFVVLSGLLVSGLRDVVGPGDVIADPMSRWTGCMRAEVAVVGASFVEAAGAWPGASAGLMGQARAWPAEAVTRGPLEQRLLSLLWRLASHWGSAEESGMRLGLALGADGLARLTAAPADDVAPALERLREQGAAVHDPEAGWRLSAGPGSGGLRSRGHDLRMRGAQQIAAARRMSVDLATLSSHLDSELRRSRARQALRGRNLHESTRRPLRLG